MTAGEYDKPLTLPPQLLNRVPAHEMSQPKALLPAGGQDHLGVIMTAGLRAHRRHQVFVADNPAGLATNHLQVLHGPVHAVLRVGTNAVIWRRH